MLSNSLFDECVRRVDPDTKSYVSKLIDRLLFSKFEITKVSDHLPPRNKEIIAFTEEGDIFYSTLSDEMNESDWIDNNGYKIDSWLEFDQ